MCLVSCQGYPKGLYKISVCGGHLCYGAASVVAVVVVTQLTANGSKPKTVGLHFISAGRWDLRFEVRILHFISFREHCERGRS